MKAECISLSKETVQHIHEGSATDNRFYEGEHNAGNYDESELIEMLQSGDDLEVWEAMGAIGKRQIKKALYSLKNIVLYHEDIGVQIRGIETIRRIGGRKAVDLLRYLKKTEHKEFIDEILQDSSGYKGKSRKRSLNLKAGE